MDRLLVALAIAVGIMAGGGLFALVAVWTWKRIVRVPESCCEEQEADGRCVDCR